MLLYQIFISYATHRKYKKSQTKTINLKYQLKPVRSYFVSDIQDYLEYIIKKH